MAMLTVLAIMSVTAAQAAAPAASCPGKQFPGTHFHCRDNGTVPAPCKQLSSHKAADPGGCCSLCAAAAACKLWTFDGKSGTTEGGLNCYLKSKVGGGEPLPSASAGSTSGSMPPAPPPAPTPPAPTPPAPTPLPPVPPGGFKNVLFIAVDDLRPEIAAYGHSYMHTPNIDKFAGESTLFTRAYVQYSYCAPSRNSFMTGRRPDATKCWSFLDHFREEGVGDSWISMPEWFRLNGFGTTGCGKLFHPGLPPNFDAKHSWQKFVNPAASCGSTNGWPVNDGTLPWVSCPKVTGCDVNAKVAGDGHWCALDRAKLTLPLEDDLVLTTAQTMLAEHAQALNSTAKRPFFQGVGFHKPHLPFYFPKEFLAFYPPAAEIAPPLHPNPPTGARIIYLLLWNYCLDCLPF